MNFACNPDESVGFSEKVHRYTVYECWESNGKWYVDEVAECDTKEAIGTMLVQLADDRPDSPAKVMALWDRLDERWITGTP